MRQARVVVTGATGNVGLAVLESLNDDDSVESVLALSRRRPDRLPAKARWVRRDVVHDELESSLTGADAVVHLAWNIQPTRAPTTTWETNVEGSQRLFNAAAAVGTPTLVYVSSVGAYSPGPKNPAVDEDWRTDGWADAAYPREKAYVERILDAFELSHPETRVVRFRPAFVLQRRAATEQRRLFAGPFVPQRLLRKELIPLVPALDGLCFQVVHAQDVAEAIRLALGDSVAGAFNLASDPPVDSTALARVLDARSVRVPTPTARTLLRALWTAHVVPVPPGLFDAFLHLPVMATQRAHDLLGWKPAWSASDTLRDLLAGLPRLSSAPTPPLAK